VNGGTYQAEADGASEAEILGIALDFGVGEEKCHGDQGADDHCAAPAPEVLGATHEAGQDGTGDGAQVGDGVVAPDLAVGETTELGAARADVDGEEDVVERVGEADEKLWWFSASSRFSKASSPRSQIITHPTEPNQRRAETHLARGE